MDERAKELLAETRAQVSLYRDAMDQHNVILSAVHASAVVMRFAMLDEYLTQTGQWPMFAGPVNR